jgi:hypothetical protein
MSSYIFSFSAWRYLAIVFSTALVLVSTTSTLSYIGYRSGTIDLTVFDLYRYQQAKLQHGGPVNTIFVGDSSLGNAIDASYWSKLSGNSALNLALAGSFGYPGYYNVLRQAVTAHSPKLVIVMATAETMQRAVSYRGYLITTTLTDALDVVPPITFVETYANGETAWRVLRRVAQELTGSLKSRIRGDYIAQRARLTDPIGSARLAGDVLNADRIQSDQLQFLRAISELCGAQGLTCVYAHGPILDIYCKTSKAYLTEASQLIESTGLIVVDGTPVCVPPSEVGDSVDHVGPTFKREYTRRYFELITSALNMERELLLARGRQVLIDRGANQ